MKFDAINAIGGAGLTLLSAGVCSLAGWEWMAIMVGSLLLILFCVREIRALRA